MKKSILNLTVILKGKLIEFPNIVNSLENKDAFFLSQLFLWIKKIEDVLTTHNISDVSELAGLRSKILTPQYSDEKRISLKKAQLKIASECLYDIQHIVLKISTPFELKIEESRELIRQLLHILSQTQQVKYNPELPFDNLINEIWQFISSNEQLRAGAIKLKTLLPINDIFMLIAEEINIEEF
jgi:hypothetical protein